MIALILTMITIVMRNHNKSNELYLTDIQKISIFLKDSATITLNVFSAYLIFIQINNDKIKSRYDIQVHKVAELNASKPIFPRKQIK